LLAHVDVFFVFSQQYSWVQTQKKHPTSKKLGVCLSG
jgi:hypothetical protein